MATKTEALTDTRRLELAISFIEEVVGARTSTFEDKSEHWQESDNGQEYESLTSEIQGAADEVESVLGQLE